jgi:hypothetical protein
VSAIVAAVAFSWARLFVGMDLLSEGYYILVPWRWALGDRPFVNNIGLDQTSAVLTYPFLKAFAIIGGRDATGIVLYTRHLYLLLMIGVAVAVFLLVRRLVCWQPALLVASVYVTYVFWATPQLSYNTICLALVTLGAALGARVVVEGKGRLYAVASGAAFGAAVVAYPSLLLAVPFYAIFFVFAQGRRAVALVAQGALVHPPDPPGPPTGRAAWRALSAWVLGGLLVLLPAALVMASFGPANLLRSLRWTLSGASGLQRLGGASKAVAVSGDFWRLFTWRPYLIVAGLLAYLVYRRWPRVGRAFLASMPVVFWFAAQRPLLHASGYVLVYGFIAPYLYLFVPPGRRETGAQLLLWIWAPAVIAGTVTAYSSSYGYVNGAIGMTPTLFVSGLFLAWALEATMTTSAAAGEAGAAARSSSGRHARSPWLALVVLTAVLGVTISLQFEYQQLGRPFRDLTSRMGSGPWWGIKVTPDRQRSLDGFAADLKVQGRPGDQLLVFDGACGLYLYWRGGIATKSYWMVVDPATGRLPRSTISYYRAYRIVPTLVVHLLHTEGMTATELRDSCAGLYYPPTLVRPGYAFQRKPADETTAEVLARLPR